jgi:hypothetical protein
MSRSILQIIQGDEIIPIISTPEEIAAALQRAKPGRYIIEESSVAGELLPSGYSCQR